MNAFRFIRILFAKFPGLLAINTGLLLLTSLFEAGAVLSIAPLVDSLIYSDSQQASGLTRTLESALAWLGFSATLTTLLAVFVGFNFLRSVFLIGTQHFIQRTKYAVLSDLMFSTFDDFLHARWYFFTSTKQGKMLNTFLREINYVADAFGAMGQIFASILQMTLYLVVPLYISWQVTSLCLTAALLFALPFNLMGKISFRLGQVSTRTANELGSAIHECISSVKIIIGFGTQQSSLARFRKTVHDHVRAALRSQTLVYGLPLSYAPFGMSVFALALWAAQHWEVPLSNTAVLLYSLFRIVPAISQILGQKNVLDNYYPSYEQVVGLGEQARQMRQPSGGQSFTGLSRELVMEEVYFAYPENDPILSDIDVRIPKGKMVAFVGESGSGKSTLIDLIMRFHEPTDGRIEVDGVPLADFNVNSYRDRIGFVPQDSILFNMTVRENLLWAKEDATDEQIRKACRHANAEEFIEKLQKRYETVVGDRGVRLSGGQVERLALARAILRNPEILILDEATSSLDTHSERLIQAALQEIAKATTLIVIAHRLSSIVNADLIYVMKHGRIAEKGSYAELIRLNGLFAQMNELQILDVTGQQETPLA